MIARVRGPISAEAASAESQGCRRPAMSAKTGEAPLCAIALTVATNVMDGTITSSPGPSPMARHMSWSAAVPLETATACAEPA